MSICKYVATIYDGLTMKIIEYKEMKLRVIQFNGMQAFDSVEVLVKYIYTSLVPYKS